MTPWFLGPASFFGPLEEGEDWPSHTTFQDWRSRLAPELKRQEDHVAFSIMTHVILNKMSDGGIWNPDDDPRAFPDNMLEYHLPQETVKTWLNNRKLDEIVWEVLLAFNMGQLLERDVHYTPEYRRDGVMKNLHLHYDKMNGPVRDYVAAISGIAINQTRKDVYMDQIYRVSDWGPGPKTLHDKAKAIYEAHVGGRRGRPGRDESWGSHGWRRGRGGSRRRDQSGGSQIHGPDLASAPGRPRLLALS